MYQKYVYKLVFLEIKVFVDSIKLFRAIEGIIL